MKNRQSSVRAPRVKRPMIAPTADFSAQAPSRSPPKVLVGQKALVTGASSGIGRAVAVALAQAGADVVVNYASGEDRAEEVVTEIRRTGSKAYAARANVSLEKDVEAMFRQIIQEFGTIDILINNAGVQR